MKHRIPIAIAAAFFASAALYGPTAQAHPVTEVKEDFGTTPAGIYWRGVLYRAGMKLTRPLGTNDGGYPYGSFAISWNEGEGAFPGLGPHMLDSYAQLQDSSNAPWEIEFDRLATSFSINANDAPGGTTDVVWVKAYDSAGTLVAEKRIKRSKSLLNATTVTVDSPAEGVYFSRVSFGSEQNGVYGWGVFWGNIKYTPLATQ